MTSPRKLTLLFHGQIIDHLGIQMYQSPVAAIAEMVSNSWDADSPRVEIKFNDSIDGKTIEISDQGSGMTFEECQKKFLQVGRCRRGKDPNEKSPIKNRPILGRKGIGKFAGFGIAEEIEISTISSLNGEATTFTLNLSELRTEEYVGTTGVDIKVQAYESPDKDRKSKSGTKITLRKLSISRLPSPETFMRSLGRKFTLYENVSDFEIIVQGTKITAENEQNIQYSFPTDYPKDKMPADIKILDNGWGEEAISSGRIIKWKFNFYKDTISEEELRGISVFCEGKLAQAPFHFNLTGGFGGQHGIEYLTGKVEAGFIDHEEKDIIATERQRLNWNHPVAAPLLVWGQDRIRELLEIWKDLRSAARLKQIADKVDNFSERLSRYSSSEQKTMHSALSKIAKISTLTDEQFIELGEALLTAWENGRLKDLIDKLGEAQSFSSEDLIKVLLEAKVLTALHVAEAIKAKLAIISTLKQKIDSADLENSIRDFIADNPWIVGPNFETYKKETRLKDIFDNAEEQAEKSHPKGSLYIKKIDLALTNGREIFVLEFMKPLKPVDHDHLNRFELYCNSISVQLAANTGLELSKDVKGLLIADKLDREGTTLKKLETLQKEGRNALTWKTLLSESLERHKDYLKIIVSSAPEDSRLKELLELVTH